MGCIMGSKNLKAVAVRGTMDVSITHPVEALEYNKRFIDQITSSKVNQTMGTIGTPFIWGATNSWGGVRTRNFQFNQCDYSDDLEPERIDEIALETVGENHMAACFACQVHCRGKHHPGDREAVYRHVYARADRTGVPAVCRFGLS